MNSFIKIAMVGIALTFPTDSIHIQQKDVFEAQDYSKYDDLVKDIPSAERLIILNKKLDNLNEKLKGLENGNE